MEILFESEHSVLLIILCLLVAVGVTTLVYLRHKENIELGKWQIRLLLFFRFTSFFLIAIMLLSPLVKSVKRFINNPKIVIAADNSFSVRSVSDSIQQKANVNGILNQLNNELGNEYSLVNYLFGETTRLGLEPGFEDKKSDYNELVQVVYNNHYNENIGALVVVGDGIYNKGLNPNNGVQKLKFPVYTVGLGDTTVVSDSKISGIRVNRTVFTGNQFPVEIDLEFIKQSGQNVNMQVWSGNDVVFRQTISVKGENFFTTVKLNLLAEEPGIQHYTVILGNSDEERNKQNNASRFVITALDSKQKILILSEGPHPDMGSVKDVLELQQKYEVSLITQQPYPDNYNKYNLIILNQLPSTQNTAGEIISLTSESKTPLLLFTGGKTFLSQLNKLDLGVEIVPQAGSNEEATPILNQSYELFRLSEEAVELLDKLPPLQVPFAKYITDPSYNVLLQQKVKNIATSWPLIVTGHQNNRKIGFVFGEGIWRWQLYNYYLSESHKQFNELIGSLIQYMAIQENEDNFIIHYESVYNETDLIIFNAEVYNEAFEPYNEPEVTMQIQDKDGNKYPFSFDKSGNFYRLDAGSWPVGDYTFEAEVTLNDVKHTESGTFAVMPVNVELLESQANHNLLYQMAKQTGGEFYGVNEITQLVNAIKANSKIQPESYTQSALSDILNMKWVFFVILLLLTMEWFLRKFWGVY